MIEDEVKCFTKKERLMLAKKNIANDHSIQANDNAIQANDNATLIVNGNQNNTKVRLALKIEDEVKCFTKKERLMLAKKNIANDHSIQANDNATLIVNGNQNNTKVRLALKIEDEVKCFTKKERLMLAKKNIANDHSIQVNDNAIQANDNATLIVNGNQNNTKVRLALKIEELEAEKQKWIDDELAKHGVLGGTDAMIKSVHTQADARYDARLASLRKTLNEL